MGCILGDIARNVNTLYLSSETKVSKETISAKINMEGLGGFDDDLFEDTQGREERKAPISYNAKFVDSQWFEKEMIDEDDPEYQNKLRYIADHAFYNARYEVALDNYQKCLVLLPENNITVWRDLNEAIAHCHAKLSHKEEAETCVRKLCSNANTFEHKTSAWFTGSRVYQQLNNRTGELLMRQALAMLHSANPDCWRQLGDTYKSIDLKKQAACYIRSRYLLQVIAPNISGISKQKNIELQEELSGLLQNIALEPDEILQIKKGVKNILYSGDEMGDGEELTDHKLALQINPFVEDFSTHFEEKCLKL